MAYRYSFRNQPSLVPLESHHESHPHSRGRSADRAHRGVPPAPHAAEVPGMPCPDVAGRWRLAVQALLETPRPCEGHRPRQRVDSGHLVVATTGYRPRFLGGV